MKLRTKIAIGAGIVLALIAGMIWSFDSGFARRFQLAKEDNPREARDRVRERTMAIKTFGQERRPRTYGSGYGNTPGREDEI